MGRLVGVVTRLGPLTAALLVGAFVMLGIQQMCAPSNADLIARTDSADARVARLAGEVFAAEAREARLADSIGKLARNRAVLLARAGAERLKSDSLLMFALHMDSIAVPKPLVVHIVASLQHEIVLRDSVISSLVDENRQLHEMYRSADSGRAVLFDALAEQRTLTQAWKREARPPLLSLKRVRPAVGCTTNFSTSICGVGVSYAF